MITEFINYIPTKTDEFIIFDVGSRDCEQSIEFYKQFPNAKIYAFECNPNTLALCRKNIEPYSDRITLIEGAVCDYDGTITFFPINQKKTKTTWKDGNPGASSIFKSNGKYTIENYVQDEITTNCHRLDTVMTKYNIPRVDIIWLDLQGAELLALKGLGDYLKNVKYIHTEVSHKEIYTGQVMYAEFHQFMKENNFLLKNKLRFNGWQEDAIYENVLFDPNVFDILILVGPKDLDVIYNQVKYTKYNIVGYRNIYIISVDPSLHIDGCHTINEDIFPFNINTVAKIHGKNERNGWYYQQLLKLYAGMTIKGILDKYLVIDCDTFFFKPTTFIEDGKCLYNCSDENHEPYFEHMRKLHPSLGRVNAEMSGICHHMMFETKYIMELFDKVHKKHKEPFYMTFLKHVPQEEITKSGASEYEIYFNYMLKFHPEHIKVRPLKWINTSRPTILTAKMYDYMSWHWYSRPVSKN